MMATPQRVERLAAIVLRAAGYKPLDIAIFDVGQPGSIIFRALADCPCGNMVRLTHAWPPGSAIADVCQELKHEVREHLRGDGLV